MVRRKVLLLYILMDVGYSSKYIWEFTYNHMEAVPLIDFNAYRNGFKEKTVPAKKKRYNTRTTE